MSMVIVSENFTFAGRHRRASAVSSACRLKNIREMKGKVLDYIEIENRAKVLARFMQIFTGGTSFWP